MFAQGQRYVNADFVIIAADNGGPKARLGLAISRRRAARAVDRNRIKRIVRESFRLASASLPATDIVTLARSHTARQPAARLFASLDRHWQSLRRDSPAPPPAQQPSNRHHG